MNVSPEFQRNLWLELTPHRLLGMPAIITGIFFLVYLGARPDTGAAIAKAAIAIYFILTLLWGTRSAGDAVSGEIKDRTWDAQRMSSIDPWPMTWGKLFGSTVYSWYGGAFCLVVYAWNTPDYHGISLVKILLLSVAGGVMSQAVALLASLQVIRKTRSYSRSLSTTYILLGVLSVWSFLSLGFSDLPEVIWFSKSYGALNFALVMLLILLVWTLLGIYRQMRAELQVHNTPLVWILFVLFIAFVSAGFINIVSLTEEKLATARLFMACNLIIGMVYLMVFVENKDPIILRRLLVAWSQRDWRRVLEQCPNWIATLLLAVVASMFVAVRDYPVLDYFYQGMQFRPYLVAACLFMLRDVALIIYFNLGQRRKRADMAATLYLAVLYFLIPGILKLLHLDLLMAMFVPLVSQYPGVTLLAGGLQAGALMWLLARRWRQGYGQVV